MKTKIWIMTLDQAMEFYQQSIHREATKQEEKERVLEDMNIKSLLTNATPDEVVKLLSEKHKVLQIRKKNDGKNH